MKPTPAFYLEQLESRVLLSGDLNKWAGIGGIGQMAVAASATYDVLVPEGTFMEQGGLAAMEAENSTASAAGVGSASQYAWQETTTLAGYSGASALETVTPVNVNLGDSTDGPRLDYAINFTTPGTYYVWVRMLGSSGSKDSVHVGIDGLAGSLGGWGVTDTSGTWHWEECITGSSGTTRVSVEVPQAGVHTFNVWMREGGTGFDKVVLTVDPSLVPAGAGPAETPRAPDPGNGSGPGLIPGDANMDGVVDSQDFTIMSANYGRPGTFSEGDFNNDGIVDGQDFGILKANFGVYNLSPTAVLSSDATTGYAPLVVNFDASASSDPDGDPLTCAWDFGDGSHAQGVQVSHEYVAAGDYAVTLVVFDGRGGGGVATTTVSLISAPLAEGAFIEEAGLAVMEAENFTADIPGSGTAGQYFWQETTALAGYSGACAMQAITPFNVNLGDGTNGPRLDYAVEFDTPGVYYVWVRMLGSSGSKDSVHVGLDGQAASLAGWGVTDTSGTWHWEECITGSSGTTRVSVEVPQAGVHTFNVWMREGGTGFDKVVLTMDPGFVPDGQGPAQSLRVGYSQNQPPVAADDYVSANEEMPVTIAVLANDSDADGDVLSIVTFTQASHGAVVDNGDGTLTYTPAASYSGADGFAYTVTDGNGGEATGEVYVTIKPKQPGSTDRWLGLGSPYHIDRDGDGRGVASPLGPDADDTDPNVTTLGSALQKYGSLEAFLNYLGYYPQRMIFVSKYGNNATAEVGNIDRPFTSYGSVPGGVQPGDVVIYREGTWQSNYIFNATNVHGTAGEPIVFMAMPGERVVFDATDQSIEVGYSSNLVLDGFICANTQGWYGKGIGTKFSSNIVFRNLDSSGHTWGMIGNKDLHDILIEYSVFHDNPIEHGVYLCGDFIGDSDITFRNNIIHSNNLGGISLLLGVQESVFRNNLIFNNNKQGIILYNYDDYTPAFDQINNVLENNLIWIGRYSWNGGTEPKDYCGVLVKDGTAAQEHDLGHNTFRNNIIVTYYGEAFRFSKADFADTTTIESNLIYRVGGDGAVMYVAGSTCDFAGFESFSPLISGNTFAQPKFADVSINYYLTPEKFDFTIVG